MYDDAQFDQSLNLDELKKKLDMSRAVPTVATEGEETKVTGSIIPDKIDISHLKDTSFGGTIPMTNEIPKNDDIPEYVQPQAPTYDGPGLVVNKEEFKEEVEHVVPTYTGITPETQSYLDAYMEEFDKEIAEVKEAVEEKKATLNLEDDDDDEEEPSMSKDEFQQKYNEAVVIIDKSGFGKIINFTKDEHDKLEKSKKIKLEEVENISLDAIKTKKPKKKDVDKIIKRVANITTTNIVLPISGYTAEIKGCSVYELISLIDTNTNALLNAQTKWSLIHSKLENTSLGKMEFNDFLLQTASMDYNTFMYGLLCSTYPDDDEMPLTCEKCKKPFNHRYSVHSLIRAEAMGEKLQDTVMTIVDSSVSEESAKNTHDNSLISYVKRIKLPQSGIIAEIYVQSAYDLINKSIKDLVDDNVDEKYQQTAVLSTLVNTFYLPDQDEPGSYFEITSGSDISKTLYNMNEIDLLIIRKIGEDLLDDMAIKFGLMDVTCPHCKNYIPFIEMDLENILFQRYRQALSTVIE